MRGNCDEAIIAVVNLVQVREFAVLVLLLQLDARVNGHRVLRESRQVGGFVRHTCWLFDLCENVCICLLACVCVCVCVCLEGQWAAQHC